jgi:hypothetical protein
MIPTICAILLSCQFLAAQQETSGWQHVKVDDPLHGKSYEKFILHGKYLTPPRVPGEGFSPSVVIVCSNHKFDSTGSYLAVGAVVADNHTLVTRVDGKKKIIGVAGISTDGTALYLYAFEFKKLLQAHEVIIGVDEFLGPEVVMQFEMPDPSTVYAACTKSKE